MKKKEFFNDLAIAVALNNWVYGLIIVAIYFLSSMLISKIRSNKKYKRYKYQFSFV